MKKKIFFITALLVSLGLNSQTFNFNLYEDIDGKNGYSNAIMEAEDGNFFMSVSFYGDANLNVVNRIVKINSDGELINSNNIEIKGKGHGEHRGFYPFFRNPNQPETNVYVYFTYGEPTCYNAIVFDNNLNIKKRISTPMPYSDVVDAKELITKDTERCILDSENNIVVMKRFDGSQNFLFVKMDLDGNIIAQNEVKIDLNLEKSTIPYHALTIYNENPLQYAFSFTQPAGLEKLSIVVLDADFNVIDKDLNNVLQLYRDYERINVMGYDDESYLTSTSQFSVGDQISYSINLRKMNKSHELINEYEHRFYRSEDKIPYLYGKNILKTEDGNIFWIYSLTRDARDGQDLYISYFDKDLNLLWERRACEYMSHNADILSAIVRNDGSLVLNGNGKGWHEGELGFFTIIMDKNGQPLNVEESMELRPYSFYPNPVNDVINMRFSPDVNVEKVEIYGIDGKLYHEQNFNMETININSLSNGIYMMKVVMDNGKTYTDKIVVK